MYVYLYIIPNYKSNDILKKFNVNSKVNDNEFGIPNFNLKLNVEHKMIKKLNL